MGAALLAVWIAVFIGVRVLLRGACLKMLSRISRAPLGIGRNTTKYSISNK